MKYFLLCFLCFSLFAREYKYNIEYWQSESDEPVICVKVDKEKFLWELERELLYLKTPDCLLHESFDIYTFYWIQGKSAGLMEARKIFEECQVIDP